jgi:hypothetical protein
LVSCTSQEDFTIPESKKEAAVTDISQATKILVERQKMSHNQVLLLLPLSGPHKEIGNGILNACMLSANEPHEGGVNFHVIDTSDPKLKSYELYEKFKNTDLKAIIGPVFFNEAKQFGVLFPNTPVFTFSNNMKVNNAHVFSCGVSPQDEIHAIFLYAKRHKLQDFLVMLPESELGNQLLQYINEEASKSGFNDSGEVETVRYRSMSSKSAKTFIRNSGKRAVFLVDPLIDPEKLTNIHIFTLSSSVFAAQERWQGAYFAFSREPDLERFKNKYQKIYGNTPGMLDIIGYDICNLLYNIVQDDTTETSLYSRHRGCLGTFSIRKNRGLVRRLSVKQVGDDTSVSSENDKSPRHESAEEESNDEDSDEDF